MLNRLSAAAAAASLALALAPLLCAALPTASSCARRVVWFNDFDSMHLLAWRVEQGQNTTVLLEPTYPWEADVHSEGTVGVLRLARAVLNRRPAAVAAEWAGARALRIRQPHGDRRGGSVAFPRGAQPAAIAASLPAEHGGWPSCCPNMNLAVSEGRG